jgi:putative ATPase
VTFPDHGTFPLITSCCQSGNSVDRDRHLGFRKVVEAQLQAFQRDDGDARRALGALEVAVLSSPSPHRLRLSATLIADAVQRKAIRYDPTGDDHYDAASALIKSMRGSDPDAARAR